MKRLGLTLVAALCLAASTLQQKPTYNCKMGR